MQVTGSATVAAPVQRVWEALQDPAVLARTIPGCHALEPTGPDTYRMTVSAGVASVQGTYVGQVELADPDPPRSFVLRARGQGAPGTVDATVRVRLSDGAGAGSTRVDYDAEAAVGGMIGGVGQRMLGGVAKRTAGQFFAAVAADLARPEAERAAPAAEPAAAESAAVPAAVSPALASPTAAPVADAPVVTTSGGPPPGRAPAAGTAPWPMVAAFATGGGIALAGVAIGYALGRGGRRAGRPA
ncbi:SRPBCC family protein [Spirillospora sp. NBC_01491]|uniref:SRPBCC family protein n=1 Tax=Spirillospora sp. NBC_01491 TaxID=2976007 RepID=UPI002E365BD7|nr:carbon monoxide dehydrogenase subunit G [Spirillospora sp. NBC_01491]